MSIDPEFLNSHIPFARHIGLKPMEITKDRITAKMEVTQELCNPMGGLHGGAAMAMADSMGAMGAFRNLPEGANGTTTIESKTNFIGVAKLGETVIGETTPVHVGKRTSIWTTRITTETGKLVAVVTQTQMTL